MKEKVKIRKAEMPAKQEQPAPRSSPKDQQRDQANA